MPLPEILKCKLFAPNGDGQVDGRTGVTLYALSIILPMGGVGGGCIIKHL